MCCRGLRCSSSDRKPTPWVRSAFYPSIWGWAVLASLAVVILLVPSLAGQSSPPVEPIYLEPIEVFSSTGGDGLLGLTAALNSTHMAMGAPWRTLAGYRRAGAVEVTSAEGDYLFTLENPTLEIGALFGNALAIGEGALAVGASHADRTFIDSGVVYLYDLAGQLLAPPIENPGSSGFFGRELVLTVDDELVVAAVGSPGAVYRFDLSGFEVASAIANPDAAAFPIFATSLAVTPHGDLWTTGLSFPNPGGVVYRFAADGTLLARILFADVTELYVATVGDGEVLVGALVNGEGEVWRLDRKGKSVASYRGSTTRGFGRGLAQAGNWIAIGAPEATGGAVYLFDRAGTLKRTITPLEATTGAEFGRALGARGELLVIGAPATDINVIATATVHLLAPATLFCNRPIEDFDQVLLGTDGIDELTGGSGDDLIVLFDGDDSARGRQGDDCLLGGRGRDFLNGNRGFDHLDGGPGDQDRCRNGEVYENCEG